MEQYISKSALVAEIKKLIRKNELYLDDNVLDTVRFQKTGAYSVLCDLQHFLDTLEVKEVDLEKEIDNIWNPRFNLGWDEKSLLGMNHEGFATIAEHFFELGLKAAQKGE